MVGRAAWGQQAAAVTAASPRRLGVEKTRAGRPRRADKRKLVVLGQGCPTVRGATPHTAGIAQCAGARSDAKRTGDSKLNLWRSPWPADSRNIALQQPWPKVAFAFTAASLWAGASPPSISLPAARAVLIAKTTLQRHIVAAIKGDMPCRSAPLWTQQTTRRWCCSSGKLGCAERA